MTTPRMLTRSARRFRWLVDLEVARRDHRCPTCGADCLPYQLIEGSRWSQSAAGTVPRSRRDE